MVAPNSSSTTPITSSSHHHQGPFTMLSVPAVTSTVMIQPIRRVSDASIDKFAIEQAKRVAASSKKKSLINNNKKTTVIKKGTTTKTKKAVRFSDSTTPIVIVKKATPPTTTASDAAAATTTWFQPKDYARFKYGILHSVQEIKKVFQQPPPCGATNNLDCFEQQHCLRGIETALSTQLYQRRKLRIAATKQVVFEQQRQQRLVGVFDPMALRAVSLMCSEEATESAISTGKLDSRL